MADSWKCGTVSIMMLTCDLELPIKATIKFYNINLLINASCRQILDHADMWITPSTKHPSKDNIKQMFLEAVSKWSCCVQLFLPPYCKDTQLIFIRLLLLKKT